ncbi:MAG TPA: phosphoribosylglycinamide formyltransferase [bacterium]|nr:phosphoribosylglycinamide formyltransferase [bacterium]HPN42076.1 phosphoribosylglycinamide formyltransferase [bacterium]
MKTSDEPLRVTVFASGRGSNLEAILKNINAGKVNARIVAVISNNSKAGALELAGKNNIPAYHISQKQYTDEHLFSDALLKVLQQHNTQLIALAGYMKKIPLPVIRAFKDRILNIHPALLPSFGGHGLYGHFVHEAVLNYGCKISGATVHIVDEDYDTGPPVCQQCVPVLENDTPDTLAARVLAVEHEIFSQAIQLFAQGRVQVKGRRVIIADR